MINRETGTLYIEWSYMDVQGQAESRGMKIPSREESIDILESMESNHDCNTGITWDAIDYELDEWIIGEES